MMVQAQAWQGCSFQGLPHGNESFSNNTFYKPFNLLQHAGTI